MVGNSIISAAKESQTSFSGDSWPGITVTAFKTWKKRFTAGDNIDDGHHYRERKIPSHVPKAKFAGKEVLSKKVCNEAANLLNVPAKELEEALRFLKTKRKTGAWLLKLFSSNY